MIFFFFNQDLFTGPHEFVVGYSKAPEQPQSSARPICHSHAMKRTGHEPATFHIAAYELAMLRTAPRETIYFYDSQGTAFLKIYMGSMPHSYKPSWLGTWHWGHIYKRTYPYLLRSEAGGKSQHIFFMRLLVTHHMSSSP